MFATIALRHESLSDGLCRPFRDSIFFRFLSRHFRAGLWIVPSLRDWFRCFDKLVWSWATLRLFNLNGQNERSKRLIWTSASNQNPIHGSCDLQF